MKSRVLTALLLAYLVTAPEAGTATAQTAGQKPGSETLTAEVGADSRRRFDALLLVVDEADRAQRPEDRAAKLRELLELSATYASDYPAHTEVWLLRAAACLELDYPTIGWTAGQYLLRSPLAQSTDGRIRNVMAQLERRGWLGRRPIKKAYLEGLTQDQLIALGQTGDAEAVIASYGKMVRVWIYDQLRSWILIAARQGHTEAYNVLGFMARSPQASIFKGPTPSPSVEGGLRWYRLAALHEDVLTMKVLGDMYADGGDVPRNDLESIRAYTAAAERGNAYSQMRLAKLLAAASDAKHRNGAEALRWIQAAFTTVQKFPEERSGSGMAVEDTNLYATLAAVHAENGNWSAAVEAEQKSVDAGREFLKKNKLAPGDKAQEERQLEEYKRRRPLRLPPPAVK